MSDEVVGVVLVGEKEYNVIKRGRAQADQVLKITRWLATYGVRAADKANKNGGLQSDNWASLLAGLIEGLDADALIDLFTALIGCTKKEAEEYFDIATLVDAGIAIYEGQPSVRKLIDRFFSSSKSEEPSEELSTTSEQPTDGPTT